MSDSCNLMDCSQPDSSVHGLFQASILEWVAISFSRGLLNCRQMIYQLRYEGSRNSRKFHILLTSFLSFPPPKNITSEKFPKRKTVEAFGVNANLSVIQFSPVQLLSHVQLFVTLWTLACQVPLSVGFSRQVYWSGLPFLLQGIFMTQGLNLGILHCR